MIKVNLKKMLGLVALGMTLLTTTAPTWAGYVYPSEVSINEKYSSTETYVNGGLVGARYSADNKQYIGCNLYAPASGSPQIACYALDSVGKFALCTSTDPRYVEQAQRMTDSSSIVFKVNRANSTCSMILITDSSYGLK